jgi:isopentenyl phosphate kinase
VSTLPTRTLLVKWGGSLLTDKTGDRAARPATIRRLAGELAAARDELAGRGVGVILGHGSGSFGHVAAARYRIQDGLSDPEQVPGVAITQRRARQLHEVILDALEDAGVPAFSIAPSSAAVFDGGALASFETGPVTGALAAGLVPVVYGDVVVDRSRGAAICSTETAFRALAEGLEAPPICCCLWLGETDGVYDRDGETIPRITPDDGPEVLGAVGTAAGTDVTGGMAHRVAYAQELARRGLPSWIGNGAVAGRFEAALRGFEDPAGVPGTWVVASRPTPAPG